MNELNEASLRLVRLPEVMGMVGVPKETILYWMRRGQFPRPLLLGQRARAWRLDEIQQWMESRERVTYREERGGR